MSISTQILTADEFWSLPGDGKRRELVRGEVVDNMPPGARHGSIQLRLGSKLQAWSDATKAGWVGVEAGFVLFRKPDTVRGPDVAFVRTERIPPGGEPTAFWDLAPDLAVEVVSPDESADDIQEKVSDYLAAGTQQVWVVYPKTRAVVVHTPDGLARTLHDRDVLSDAHLLAGFSCQVADLFVA